MSWLKYLQETLGVRSVLWPISAMETSSVESIGPAVARKKTPQIVFIDIQPWTRQETDLFEKMRVAMKLSKEQTKIIFATPAELPQKSLELLTATCAIFFSPELATQSFVLPEETFVMTTFGPRELLPNPQLKKQSWDDLQKVMKKLE
jgi:hypothetical protein